MTTKRARYAGTWYPGSAKGCADEISRFISGEEKKESYQVKGRGGIVPHAGWFFSGKIACNVIYHLSRIASPDIIVLFGMHLPQSAPVSIMSSGKWETPLGDISIDDGFASGLVEKCPFLVNDPDDFLQDNTIELQLPFIKHFFDGVPIVPIGAPPNEKSQKTGSAVAVLSHEMKKNVLVIGSTDLTHYGPNYGFTPKGRGEKAMEWVRKENDRSIINAMIDLKPDKVLEEAVKKHNACCSGAASAAIKAGMDMGADSAKLIEYATSYDKSPGDSLVGYVGIIF